MVLKDILTEFLNEEPIIIYKPIYADMFGSISVGLLAGALIYWSKTMNHGQFYKTDEDLCRETGMKIKQFRAAKKQIMDSGAFSIEIKSLPAKTYYQINLSKLIKLIEKHRVKKGKTVCLKEANRSAENRQTLCLNKVNEYAQNRHATSETKASIKTEINTQTTHARGVEPETTLVELSKDIPSIDLTVDNVSFELPVKENLLNEEFKTNPDNQPCNPTHQIPPPGNFFEKADSEEGVTQENVSKRKIFKKQTLKTTRSQKFELFWVAYVLKVGKGAAVKAFERAMKKTSLEAILEALEAQKYERAERERLRLWNPSWKHPATWLNQECWNDVPKAAEEIRKEAEAKSNLQRSAGQKKSNFMDNHRGNMRVAQQLTDEFFPELSEHFGTPNHSPNMIPAYPQLKQ